MGRAVVVACVLAAQACALYEQRTWSPVDAPSPDAAAVATVAVTAVHQFGQPHLAAKARGRGTESQRYALGRCDPIVPPASSRRRTGSSGPPGTPGPLQLKKASVWQCAPMPSDTDGDAADARRRRRQKQQAAAEASGSAAEAASAAAANADEEVEEELAKQRVVAHRRRCVARLRPSSPSGTRREPYTAPTDSRTVAELHKMPPTYVLFRELWTKGAFGFVCYESRGCVKG